jgi:hypothetical protein
VPVAGSYWATAIGNRRCRWRFWRPLRWSGCYPLAAWSAAPQHATSPTPSAVRSNNSLVIGVKVVNAGRAQFHVAGWAVRSEPSTISFVPGPDDQVGTAEKLPCHIAPGAEATFVTELIRCYGADPRTRVGDRGRGGRPQAAADRAYGVQRRADIQVQTGRARAPCV